MLEAKIIGFKEGLKLALVWYVCYAFLIRINRKEVIRSINYAIVTCCIIVIMQILAGFQLPREYLANIVEMSLAGFLFLGLATLLHLSGTAVTFPTRDGEYTSTPRSDRGLWMGVVFVVTLLFFVPDLTGSAITLNELKLMREVGSSIYLYALFGGSVAILIVYLVVRFYRPLWIGDYFDLAQLFLFLAIVKLLGSGIEGIYELSLIPAVQKGLMKFIHDFVHQTLVLLMVPDHPLLKATVWDFIAIFFGSGLASALSLVLLLTIPFIFLYHRLFKPVPEPEAEKKVERRKIKAILISDRRKKALPVLIFTAMILFAWFTGKGETKTELYDPVPRPVIADQGLITVPMNDPSLDLMSGAMHKFVLDHEGEQIRFLIIRKSDNSLSVCLDACDVCPPDGYGQRTDHVVCIYCETPIHIDTLGQPGGCNPIPLAFEVKGSSIIIPLNEILDKWGFMMSGKGRG